MSSHIECPICMDDVEVTRNCVTTECGHCFHASCLMRSVAHNGFGCPYCRTTMAEVPEEEDDDDMSEVTIEEEMFDDYALRGFRFLFNNLNGEEHDEEDVLEEEEDEEEEEVAVEIVKPSSAFITQKLLDQGITMEHLVKALLKDHEEYDAEEEECLRIDDELFGKMRIIISNYTPEQVNATA